MGCLGALVGGTIIYLGMSSVPGQFHAMLAEAAAAFDDALPGREQQHDTTHRRGIFRQVDRLKSLRDHGQHDAAPRP